MLKISKNWIVRLIGVPFLTFLLFIVECTDPQFYFYELLWVFAVSLFLWEGNGILCKFLNKNLPWRKKVLPRILIQLSLSLLFTTWLTFFYNKLVFSFLYEGHFSFLIFRKDLFVFSIISILYNTIYTGEHFFKQWGKSLLEAEKLKQEHLISQYESLKSQINPHFLFNSINTLIGLIHTNPDLATEYGHHFARVYRYILEHRKDELVQLKDELEIIKIHAFLLKSRFGENLSISIDIEAENIRKYIPPLTLQMLLENAIKHNVISKQNPLKVQISSEGKEMLVIKNNIQKKNMIHNSTQVGLRNIKKRYQFIAQKEVCIIESATEFIVKIPLLNQKNL